MNSRSIELLKRAAGASLIALVSGAMLAVGMALPAAASTVSFTVRVFDQAGHPISGLRVKALTYGPDGSFLRDHATRTSLLENSAAKGTYTSQFALDAAKSYTLLFNPAPDSFVGEWDWANVYLGNVSDVRQAEFFTIGSGAPTRDVTIAARSSVTGSVVAPNGSAVKGAAVTAYRSDGSQWVALQSILKTNAAGAFTLPYAQPGSYAFKAVLPGSYAPTFSGSASTLGDAAITTVGFAATAVKVRIRMNAGGTITGILHQRTAAYDSHDYSATPIAFPLIGEPGNWTGVDKEHPYPGVNKVGAPGWRVTGLPPGYYAVYFQNGSEYPNNVGFVQRKPELAPAPWSAADSASFHVIGTETLVAPSSLDAPYIPNNLVHQFIISTNFSDGTQPKNIQVLFQRDDIAWNFLVFNFSNTSTRDVLVNPVQPGHYKITVFESSGHYFPVTFEKDLIANQYNSASVGLDLIPNQDFVTPPTLDTTETVVGTSYSVTAVAGPNTDLFYQWERDGLPIFGAVSPTYTSRGADVGHVLSVHVGAPLNFGLGPVGVGGADGYAIVGTVTTGAQITSSAPPTIKYEGSGVYAGTVLHASPGTWSAQGAHTTYEWYRDGAPTGVTAASYTVTLADVLAGAILSFSGTANAPGYPQSAPASSDAVTAIVAPAPAPKAAFVVSTTTTGVPIGSRKYTVSPGLWSVGGLTFSYRWLIGDTPVQTGPSPMYVSNLLEGGDPLRVEVTASRSGYAPAVVSQLVRKGTAVFAADTNPVLTDSTSAAAISSESDPVNVGDQLTVTDSGTWTAGITPVAPETISYQWYRKAAGGAASAIALATSATYQVQPRDLSQILSVKITARNSAWSTTGTVTLPGGTVGPSDALTSPLPSVTVTGLGLAGSPLTAHVSAWAVAGVTPHYQWFACVLSCPVVFDSSAYSVIPGAVMSVYVPTTAQRGGQIYVAVSGTKAGYTTVTAYSDSFAIAPEGTIPVLAAPSFTLGAGGAAHVGAVATAKAGTFGIPSLQHSFQWQLCDALDCSADVDWHTVGVANTFTPTGAQYSATAQLRLVDVASRVGYTSATSKSVPHPLGLGILPPSAAAKRTFTTPTTCDIVAPSISVAGAPVAPQIVWYEGSSTVGTGVDHIVADLVPNDPVYATVTYDVPGYTNRTSVVLCVKGVGLPDVSPAEDVVGGGFGTAYSIADPHPLVLPDALQSSSTLTYRWYGATAIGTKSTWMPAAADIGDDVDMSVFISNPFYSNLFELDMSTGVITTGTFVVTGGSVTTTAPAVVTEGSIVTVSAPTYSISGMTFRYNWEVSDNGTDWSVLTSTASRTLVMPHAAAGRIVRVIVVASRTGYYDVRSTGAPISVTALGTISAFSDPELSSAQVGHAAAVSPGTWTSGTTLTYQWKRDGNAVAGATGATYTPDGTAFGDELTVVVTGHKSGYADLSIESNAVVVAVGDAPVVTSAQTLTVAGSAFAVTPGRWSVSGLTITYQWYDVDTPISGATARSYVLSVGQLPADISVRVTATSTGYQPTTVTVQ